MCGPLIEVYITGRVRVQSFVGLPETVQKTPCTFCYSMNKTGVEKGVVVEGAHLHPKFCS